MFGPDAEVLERRVQAPEQYERNYPQMVVQVVPERPQIYDKLAENDIFLLQSDLIRIESDLQQAYQNGIVINMDYVVQLSQDKGGIAIYDDMQEKDPHLFSCADTLIGGAAATDYRIEAASDSDRDKEIAAFVEHVLDNFDFTQGRKDIASGKLTGFSICQIVFSKAYSYKGRRVVGVDRLKKEPERRFVVDTNGKFRLLTIDEPINGIAFPTEGKFLVFRSGPGMYGNALLKYAYAPYWFKKNATKFLLSFMERYGNPPVMGFYDYPQDQAKVIDMLMQLRSESVAAFKAGAHLPQLLEPQGKMDFIPALNFWNDEMSKVFTSGTRTLSASNAAGAYSATESHADALDARQDELHKNIAPVINRQFIPAIVNANFAGVTSYPRYRAGVDFMESPDQFVTRVTNLAKTFPGMEFSKKELREKGGFEEPKVEEDKIVATPAPAPGTGVSEFSESFFWKNYPTKRRSRKTNSNDPQHSKPESTDP